jgi:CheY-like chemotaxis protein
MSGPPVLLVEDNKDDVFFFQRAMKRAELLHPLFVVTSGRQAIEYLEGSGPYSDRAQYPIPLLIVLDLKLPQVNGLEVLEWLRTQPAYRSIIVIVFTSSQLESDIRRAYQLGANSFIVKPSSAERTLEVVKRLFSYWLDTNALPPALIA